VQRIFVALILERTRRAVNTAQVAPVGHRNAHVINLAVK